MAALHVARAACFWFLLRVVPTFSDTVLRFQLLNGVSFALVGLATLLLVRPSLSDLGIDPMGMSRRARWASVAGAAVLALAVATSAIFGVRMFVMNVTFGLAIPAFEEGLFRGWIFGGAAKAFGGRAAAVATSLLFGLWHLGYADVLLQHPLATGAPSVLFLLGTKVVIGVVLGALLGWLRLRTERTFAPFVLHGIFNVFGP